MLTTKAWSWWGGVFFFFFWLKLKSGGSGCFLDVNGGGFGWDDGPVQSGNYR